MKQPQRLYIVKKYVVAQSAIDAIRKEKKHKVHDVWLEEASQKNYVQDTHDSIRNTVTKNLGFHSR